MFLPENLQPGYMHKEQYKNLKVGPILNYADVT